MQQNNNNSINASAVGHKSAQKPTANLNNTMKPQPGKQTPIMKNRIA